jgi:hypothetical protein
MPTLALDAMLLANFEELSEACGTQLAFSVNVKVKFPLACGLAVLLSYVKLDKGK